VENPISDKIDSARVLASFGAEHFTQIEFIDTSQGEADRRYTYIMQNPDGDKIALKLTQNAFTTPERVRGWAELAEHYNSLGIYAPRFLRASDGGYSALSNGYVVYGEEFISGEIAKVSVAADNDYRDGAAGRSALETIGILASNPARLVPWRTAWCIYDKFDELDESDEVYGYAVEITRYFQENLPRYAARATELLQKYEALRAEFEPIYRSLPRAAFQGDIGNFVINPDGSFKGVFDFNLSGTDNVTNYMLCECLCCLTGKDESAVATILDKSETEKYDARMARHLAHASKFYAFSDAERAAFSKVYNISYPFRHTNYAFIMHHLRERGEKYGAVILAWLEYQMSRDAASILQ
jgi:hypothetical protein